MEHGQGHTTLETLAKKDGNISKTLQDSDIVAIKDVGTK